MYLRSIEILKTSPLLYFCETKLAVSLDLFLTLLQFEGYVYCTKANYDSKVPAVISHLFTPPFSRSLRIQ